MIFIQRIRANDFLGGRKGPRLINSCIGALSFSKNHSKSCWSPFNSLEFSG